MCRCVLSFFLIEIHDVKLTDKMKRFLAFAAAQSCATASSVLPQSTDFTAKGADGRRQGGGARTARQRLHVQEARLVAPGPHVCDGIQWSPGDGNGSCRLAWREAAAARCQVRSWTWILAACVGADGRDQERGRDGAAGSRECACWGGTGGAGWRPVLSGEGWADCTHCV